MLIIHSFLSVTVTGLKMYRCFKSDYEEMQSFKIVSIQMVILPYTFFKELTVFKNFKSGISVSSKGYF